MFRMESVRRGSPSKASQGGDLPPLPLDSALALPRAFEGSVLRGWGSELQPPGGTTFGDPSAGRLWISVSCSAVRGTKSCIQSWSIVPQTEVTSIATEEVENLAQNLTLLQVMSCTKSAG
ncbi:hypothetical protein KC19_VG042700 [Ceratodon purpureus]|uniref:Uncharacterized protein n=1 Tax=Ceratodon purpureus TaxID=3225 RepID=A0A8T0HLQ9_CERPU|nr:hypothetical protein KC19_VG042700 [Ceratodon purpureus]